MRINGVLFMGSKVKPEKTDYAFVQRHAQALSDTVRVALGFVTDRGECGMDPILRGADEVYSAFNVKLAKCAMKDDRPETEKVPDSDESVCAIPIRLDEKMVGCLIICGFIITDTGTKPAERIDRPVMTEQEFDGFLKIISLTANQVFELTGLNERQVALLEEQTKSIDAFRAFIDCIDAGVYVMDYYTGELIIYNKYYESMNKLSPGNISEKKCFEILGADTFCPFCKRDEVIDPKTGELSSISWENYLEAFDQWLQISNRGIRWIDGRLAMMVTYFDSTERKKREREMEYLAYFDEMLDMPNRMKLFLDTEKYAAPDTFLAVYDIQGLRKVNDLYGRETGDGLLHVISSWMKQLILENMTLYRIDGDSFAILMRNTTEDDARILIETIFRRFSDSWQVLLDRVEQRVLTNVTIGLFPCVVPFETISFMLNIVERVISAANATNKPLIYDETTNQVYQQHIMLEMSLKNSVLNKMEGFSVVYQPIVNPLTGKWVGLEALCRWVSPELGPIAPMIFIGVAEQHGLIDPIGTWVLTTSMKAVKENDLCGDDFILDVNLSPVQLNNRDLYHQIRSIIDAIKYPIKCLSVEITESADVHFNDHMMEILYEIQSMGLSMALDDFGTGYASFSKVGTLPVNTLKIDRTFIENIETVPFYQKTMGIMIEYAHAAGLKVVVEGVETEKQRDIVVQCGADFIQGFYYAKPMSMEEILEQRDKFI